MPVVLVTMPSHCVRSWAGVCVCEQGGAVSVCTGVCTWSLAMEPTKMAKKMAKMRATRHMMFSDVTSSPHCVSECV